MKQLKTLGFALVVLSLIGVTKASAMPQFARRTGMSCTGCHTTVPELNQMGFNYRRAGFRLPDEIGKDVKVSGLKDLYAARLREQFAITGAATDGTAANGKVPATNAFAFNEFTFYPITGAFGKYWAAESELTVAQSGDGVELENAYVRGTFPVMADLFVSVQAGIFHPFEGYGGSDRTISNIRPLFQTTVVGPLAGFGTKVWGQDQQGAAVGAAYKDTSLNVAVLNGYSSGFGAAGSASVGDKDNNRDIRVFFNQMLGENAAVSAEYLNGKTPYGYAAAGTDWTNNYQKGAIYANYKVLGDKLNILAGYGLNKDHSMNAATHDGSDSFNSHGWYAMAESKLHEHLTGVARYDTFDPNTRVARNRVSAWTLTAAIPFDEIKFLIDYQVKRSQKTLGKDRTDNILKAEWMVIF